MNSAAIRASRRSTTPIDRPHGLGSRRALRRPDGTADERYAPPRPADPYPASRTTAARGRLRRAVLAPHATLNARTAAAPTAPRPDDAGSYAAMPPPRYLDPHEPTEPQGPAILPRLRDDRYQDDDQRARAKFRRSMPTLTDDYEDEAPTASPGAQRHRHRRGCAGPGGSRHRGGFWLSRHVRRFDAADAAADHQGG